MVFLKHAGQKALFIVWLCCCVAFFEAQPWPGSPFINPFTDGHHDRNTNNNDRGVRIEKQGSVKQEAGEEVSLTDTGVYTHKSREAKFKGVYRITPDRGGEDETSPWAEEGNDGDFQVKGATKAQLLAFMHAKNKQLQQSLADALRERGGSSSRRPSGSGGYHGPPESLAPPVVIPVLIQGQLPSRQLNPDSQTDIRPQNPYLNQDRFVDRAGTQPSWQVPDASQQFNNRNQNPYPNQDSRSNQNQYGVTENRGTNQNQQFGPNGDRIGNQNSPYNPNNGLPLYSQPNAGPDRTAGQKTQFDPTRDRTQSQSPYVVPDDPWLGQNRQNANYSNPWGQQSRQQSSDPWINQRNTPDPWTNQGRNQGTYQDPRNNQGTTLDPWINQERNQGNDQDPRTNQRPIPTIDPWTNQGRDQDPWTNQGRTVDPWINQGRNQGNNQDPWINQNQGRIVDPWTNPGGTADPWINQGRNQGNIQDPWINQGPSPTKDPGINEGRDQDPWTNQGKIVDLWVNQGRNQGSTQDPWINQNQGRTQAPWTNQGGTADPWINQGRNQGNSQDPWINQRLSPTKDPWINQGRDQDPWTNQGGTVDPWTNRGSTVDPWIDQGRNQRNDQDPWTNQRPNPTRNPWTNQGRNQDPWTNQGTNADPWINQGINQGNNQELWKNQGRTVDPRIHQGFTVDPWINSGRNQENNQDPWINQRTTADPWINQGRNQGNNQDPWINQRPGPTRDPWINQARSQDPWTNQGTTVDPRINQGRSQDPWIGPRSTVDPWLNQGRNQGIDHDPWINPGNTIDPWVNQGRNQRNYQDTWIGPRTTFDPWLDQTRNQWNFGGNQRDQNTNARNQGQDPWINQGQFQTTTIDPFISLGILRNIDALRSQESVKDRRASQDLSPDQLTRVRDIQIALPYVDDPLRLNDAGKGQRKIKETTTLNPKLPTTNTKRNVTNIPDSGKERTSQNQKAFSKQQHSQQQTPDTKEPTSADQIKSRSPFAPLSITRTRRSDSWSSSAASINNAAANQSKMALSIKRIPSNRDLLQNNEQQPENMKEQLSESITYSDPIVFSSSAIPILQFDNLGQSPNNENTTSSSKDETPTNDHQTSNGPTEAPRFEKPRSIHNEKDGEELVRERVETVDSNEEISATAPALKVHRRFPTKYPILKLKQSVILDNRIPSGSKGIQFQNPMKPSGFQYQSLINSYHNQSPFGPNGLLRRMEPTYLPATTLPPESRSPFKPNNDEVWKQFNPYLIQKKVNSQMANLYKVHNEQQRGIIEKIDSHVFPRVEWPKKTEENNEIVVDIQTKDDDRVDKGDNDEKLPFYLNFPKRQKRQTDGKHSKQNSNPSGTDKTLPNITSHKIANETSASKDGQISFASEDGNTDEERPQHFHQNETEDAETERNPFISNANSINTNSSLLLQTDLSATNHDKEQPQVMSENSQEEFISQMPAEGDDEIHPLQEGMTKERTEDFRGTLVSVWSAKGRHYRIPLQIEEVAKQGDPKSLNFELPINRAASVEYKSWSPYNADKNPYSDESSMGADDNNTHRDESSMGADDNNTHRDESSRAADDNNAHRDEISMGANDNDNDDDDSNDGTPNGHRWFDRGNYDDGYSAGRISSQNIGRTTMKRQGTNSRLQTSNTRGSSISSKKPNYKGPYTINGGYTGQQPNGNPLNQGSSYTKYGNSGTGGYGNSGPFYSSGQQQNNYNFGYKQFTPSSGYSAKQPGNTYSGNSPYGNTNYNSGKVYGSSQQSGSTGYKQYNPSGYVGPTNYLTNSQKYGFNQQTNTGYKQFNPSIGSSYGSSGSQYNSGQYNNQQPKVNSGYKQYYSGSTNKQPSQRSGSYGSSGYVNSAKFPGSSQQSSNGNTGYKQFNPSGGYYQGTNYNGPVGKSYSSGQQPYYGNSGHGGSSYGQNNQQYNTGSYHPPMQGNYNQGHTNLYNSGGFRQGVGPSYGNGGSNFGPWRTNYGNSGVNYGHWGPNHGNAGTTYGLKGPPHGYTQNDMGQIYIGQIVEGTDQGSSSNINGMQVVEGLTALIHVANTSSTTGTTSGATGTTGSYFQFDPSLNKLVLVSGSGSSSGDIQGTHFQYDPSTGHLKLVTNNNSLFNTNNNGNSLQNAVFEYNTDTKVIKLKQHNGSTSSTTNSGGYIQFNPLGNQNQGTIPHITLQIDDSGSIMNNGMMDSGMMMNTGMVMNSGMTNSGMMMNNGMTNSGTDQIIGFVVVDKGTANYMTPNTGGYLQFNPSGTNFGSLKWDDGGNTLASWKPKAGWTSTPIFQEQESGQDRPFIKPGPDLFLKMFKEGEVYTEGDAVVQNFYTRGDAGRMMQHVKSLPLDTVETHPGFMTGHLKDYHVTACGTCGPNLRPMIEFVTEHVTDPRLIRRFIYQPFRFIGSPDGAPLSSDTDTSSSDTDIPNENQPKFGVPPFKNQLRDDLAFKNGKEAPVPQSI